MRILCINNDFSEMPIHTFLRKGVQPPKMLQEYTIEDQLVENGVVYVELEEVKGYLFNMERHFIQFADPVNN